MIWTKQKKSRAVLNKQINQFLQYLQVERRYAVNTQKAYGRDLHKLLDFARGQGLDSWDSLEQKSLNLWLMQMRHTNLSNRTIRRCLCSIRVFLAYLVKQGLLQNNCALGLKTPKLAQHLPKILDYSQIEQMLLFTQNSSSKLHKRDALIIEMLYGCGLRVAELVALDVADIDEVGGFVQVVGKGAKMRYVPLGSAAQTAIKHYLGSLNKTSGALLVNQQQRRISIRSVQNIIKKIALNAGIKVNVYPHMLRHTAATHFLQSSHNLRCVQEFLGHTSIKSTQIYTHLDFQELAKVYDKYHPRAKK